MNIYEKKNLYISNDIEFANDTIMQSYTEMMMREKNLRLKSFIV